MNESAVSNGTLSRREREREMRRRAMLDAAQAVFAEKGYANATVDEIAHRAEFGKGTLYNYFEGGKEDILLAIFDELYDDLCRFVDDTFTEATLAERSIRSLFEDFIAQCLGYYVARQDLFMILVKEAHRMIFSDDADRVAYFMRQHGRVVDALAKPLALGMARGALRPLPPKAVAHLILGNINGCQMQLFLERRACPDKPLGAPKDAAAFLTQMLFDGLLTAPNETPA